MPVVPGGLGTVLTWRRHQAGRLDRMLAGRQQQGHGRHDHGTYRDDSAGGCTPDECAAV